jgi:hypothetical protein
MIQLVFFKKSDNILALNYLPLSFLISTAISCTFKLADEGIPLSHVTTMLFSP